MRDKVFPICIGVMIFLSIVGGTFLVTVFQAGSEVGQEKSVREKSSEANRVVGSIKYVKDSRTGLVFAYYHDGWSRNTQPVLVLVPAEAVPKELLLESSTSK